MRRNNNNNNNNNNNKHSDPSNRYKPRLNMQCIAADDSALQQWTGPIAAELDQLAKVMENMRRSGTELGKLSDQLLKLEASRDQKEAELKQLTASRDELCVI